jgi:hypothetical protein
MALGHVFLQVLDISTNSQIIRDFMKLTLIRGEYSHRLEIRMQRCDIKKSGKNIGLRAAGKEKVTLYPYGMFIGEVQSWGKSTIDNK